MEDDNTIVMDSRTTGADPTEYIPDEWDSVFESFDQEEDEKERKIKEAEIEREKEKEAAVRELIDGLKAILDKGPDHETCSQIREFFSKGEKGFCKGDPEVFAKIEEYAKDPYFISEFKDMNEQYAIDKSSYTLLLKNLYPGDRSETVTDMRTYLITRRLKAPYRPLKKTNYALGLAVVFGVYLLMNLIGMDPGPAVVPALLVGAHWFGYRLLYPVSGAVNSHLRICSLIVIITLAYSLLLSPHDRSMDGLYSFALTYMDLTFCLGIAKIGQLISNSVNRSIAARSYGPNMKNNNRNR